MSRQGREAFDNKIVGPELEPLSSFAYCQCPDHEIMTETIVRSSYILRRYIHGHNWKGKHYSIETRKKMSESHKKRWSS